MHTIVEFLTEFTTRRDAAPNVLDTVEDLTDIHHSTRRGADLNAGPRQTLGWMPPAEKSNGPLAMTG